MLGRVKVCKSRNLLVKSPGNTALWLFTTWTSDGDGTEGVHFLQGAPLCGTLSPNLVRFSRCFRCVWALLRSSCIVHRFLAAKSEAEQCVEGGEAPPPARNLLLYSIMAREGGREGEPRQNFQNKTLLHQKLWVVGGWEITAVILCPLKLTLNCFFPQRVNCVKSILFNRIMSPIRSDYWRVIRLINFCWGHYCNWQHFPIVPRFLLLRGGLWKCPRRRSWNSKAATGSSCLPAHGLSCSPAAAAARAACI